MPHIKVKPFDTAAIDKIADDFVVFRAIDEQSMQEVVLLREDGEELFLNIVKKEKDYLIKPNSITKGAKISLLKELLVKFAATLDLEIVYTNTQAKPNKPQIAQEYLKSIEDFYNFSPEFKSVKIEVGFGSARHLLYRAKQEPQTLFIGVEIHTPSINQLLKQINLQGIKNIWVLNYDARLLLEMIPSNILDTIYVHFPVPWDKKPHRRVISKAFTAQSMRTLKKGAFLELRTDSQNYYEHAVQTFGAFNQCEFSIKKNIDIDIVSKYEERWRKMQKSIYTLHLFALEHSKEHTAEIEFSFDKIAFCNQSVPKKSIIKDDYFVHFGRRYNKSSGSGFAVECSFGNFQMPEKKMIVVDKDTRYLPTNPVKSMANWHAHNFIKEVLHG